MTPDPLQSAIEKCDRIIGGSPGGQNTKLSRMTLLRAALAEIAAYEAWTITCETEGVLWVKLGEARKARAKATGAFLEGK